MISAPHVLSFFSLVGAIALGACTSDSNASTTATQGDSDSATTATAPTTATGTTDASTSGSMSNTGTNSGETEATTTVASSDTITASATDTSGEPTTGPTDSTDSTDGTDTTDSGITDSTGTTTDTSGTTGTTGTTGDTTTTGGDGLWDTPNLWYSVDDALIYIEIDPMDGSVVKLVHNQLSADVPLVHGQNGLTMLEDGSLLGSRESNQGTQIFYIANPPTEEDTPAEAVFLGMVPDTLIIEALYTDCEGRIYLMDTGVDVSSSEGNRLLRFTGSYLEGDLSFEVITDLENASVGDIDDMSPGIVDDEISDGNGFAMDTKVLWQIDYGTGTGTELAETDGTWGVHALGGPLFDDLMPRLYILSAGYGNSGAKLMEVYINDYSNSSPLIEGPDLDLQKGSNGWSGLAGPLTECMTTIPQ